MGVSPEQASPGLRETRVPGPLEQIDRGQDFLALVDYSHKPEALCAVLTMRHPDRRPAVVCGAGGDRDRGKRAPMGRIAAELADLVVVTDDNPLGEDPASIRREILAGAAEPGGATQVIEIGDRREAIEYAVAWARPGDVLVIAGKGHETGQRTGRHTRPCDDRVGLAQALEALGAGPADDRSDHCPGRRDRRWQAGRCLAKGRRRTTHHRDRRVRLAGHRHGRTVPGVAGARSDGHDHAASAVSAGAVAVLAARPVGVRRCSRHRPS